MYTSNTLISSLKNRETLRDAFVVHRGDSRPKEGPSSPINTGFTIGEANSSQRNSVLACLALSNFTEDGLNNFCTIWKNGSGSLTIGQAADKGYFRANSTVPLDDETRIHELIRYKNFMQGVSTDAEDCHKGDNEYTITIPEPNENGYQCDAQAGPAAQRGEARP